ncbi:MAG TPA: hypothetical protein VNX21_09325 [Candidatus Thermoplasmatota archaeon]|nr:hypothetical protein [Candidatus Thermoplasmatota archaeon]
MKVKPLPQNDGAPEKGAVYYEVEEVLSEDIEVPTPRLKAFLEQHPELGRSRGQLADFERRVRRRYTSL